MRTRSIIQLLAAFFAIGVIPDPAAAQVPIALEVDLLEVHLGRGDDHLLLDSTVTVGEGDDQLVVMVAGGSETRTSFDDLELQAFYSRALSNSAALHFGIRHDMRSGPDLTHGAVGIVVQLLPNLEAEHYFFVSQNGDLTGSAQFILGVNLTPRLVLEPRLGLAWSAQAIPGEDLGHGLTDIEASLRLRRSIGENFNIYAGVVHERLVGSTRRIAVAAGDPPHVTRAIVGLGFSL